MPGFGKQPIYKNTVLASGQTVYVGLPIHDGCIGAHIGWLDATSAATITVELSSFGAVDAPADAAGSAWEWIGSGVSITGPAGSAAGGVLVNIENVRQKRGRLKIVATANCNLEIYDGGAG